MDVEKNPGPDKNCVTLIQTVDWRFLQIIQGIKMHTAHVNSKMDEKFGSLERTLGQLTADVNRLKQYVGKDREGIKLLQEDNDKTVQRLERLEQELNSLDVDSWRCDLKFLGVREQTRDNYRANVNVIVDALNECSSSRTWEHSDISYIKHTQSAPDRSPKVEELCESRGGRPGLSFPNESYGFCGRKATLIHA